MTDKDKMTNKAIIIGTGASGLMCGAMLSQHMDVELYEKSSKIGGRSRNHTISNNHVDWGPHLLRYGEMSDVLKVFDICGIEKPECSTLGVSIYQDGMLKRFTTGTGNKWKDKLSLLTMENLGILDRTRFLTSLANLLYTIKIRPSKIRSMSVPEWTEQQGLNSRVSELFHTLGKTMNTCGEIYNTSILEMGSHLLHCLSVNKAITYPQGGFKGIHDKLTDYINDNHGKIRLETNVEKIVFEGSKAKGVMIDGQLHEADHIIAAMPASALWNDLVDANYLIDNAGKERKNLEKYIEYATSMKPNSGMCIDMIIHTKKYTEKSLVIYPHDDMHSLMCMVSNTDPDGFEKDVSYLTFLGLVDWNDLNINRPGYRNLAKKMIGDVFPGIYGEDIRSREIFLKCVDGAEINRHQERADRPSSFVPGIRNLYNPSDDKKGSGGGEEISAGASIAVYRKIIK